MQALPQAAFLLLLEASAGGTIALFWVHTRGQVSRGFTLFTGICFLISGGLAIWLRSVFPPLVSPEIDPTAALWFALLRLPQLVGTGTWSAANTWNAVYLAVAGSLAALADILSLEGYLVETMSNGQEAIDHLRAVADTPALIILDLFMPVMDGWQFLAEIKADPNLSQVRIPVIVITAFNAKVEEADAVIRKPIDLERLLHTITILEKSPKLSAR